MTMDKRKSGIARLMELSGRKKGLLIVSAITASMHAMLTMVPYILIFYILKELLNGYLTNPKIGEYLIWAFVAIVISDFLMFISGMASHIAAFNILYELRCKIAAKLGKLPMGYVGNRSSGSLKKILADDVERIEKFIAHSLPDAVEAVTLPVIILSCLFVIDWRLASISGIPLLIILIIISSTFGSEKGNARMKKYHDSLEEMNGGIIEFVQAMPVMKIFGQSASSFAKYSGTVKEFDLHLKEWTRLTTPVWAVIMSFLTNALLPLLISGLYLYFKGELDLAVFFLFLILGVGYIRPAFKLALLAPQITMINRGVTRMDEILFEIEEQKSGSKSVPKEFSLEFKHACFSYNAGIEVIKDFSFTVPQGSITALVGPSGSGKSTAGQLIARFYDLSSGSITLGNVNINDLTTEDLMENVGFVFQDNKMFHQSLYDNILMGMDKTEEEVMAAAKTARCHDFIMTLPKGYETHFGRAGISLSGGEQQRIQLARVVLKDAPVLILDEATAFSDPENEFLIMNVISELIQNKTVIIIAHRLSTITDVDQIIVLDSGKVESKGTHSQLLGESKLYTRMWNAHIRAKDFEIINQ